MWPASASPSSTSDASKEDDESNVGTIAGIAVVGVLCIMAILGFVLWKKRQRARRSRPQNSSNDNDDDWAFGNGSVHDEKRSYNSSAESIHMTEMPLTPPSVPPRSANPFLAPSEPPDSPWAAPVGMAYGSGPSSAAHSLRNYPATHQSGNPSISSHRSAGPATELPYSNATPMPPAPSPVPAPLPYQPLTTTQQQQMHQQNSNLIAQPEPFRPMSQSFVTAAGLVASPAVSSEEEATGLRSPHDVSPRDSKYISGYSSTSIDEPGMASAFPAPPKPEEPLPALPDEQRRQSTSTEATARPMSYTDPIPRSLTPGGTPLHRPSMIHLDSSVARPVSQYSDTTTYETATSEIQHLYERDSIDYRRNTNQHFFLPPLQIPASGAQENDAAESLDQDLTPPSRPFAASPVEPASISAVSPKSNSPATSSPVGRVASPLKESSNEQEAIVGKERSGTLTKNPFVLGADDSTARDSFDLTSHYYYGDATTPQGGDDKRESTEVLAPAAQPRPQNRESLYRPVRVSGSDWGFLNDLLEDPQVTGQQGGKDVGK